MEKKLMKLQLFAEGEGADASQGENGGCDDQSLSNDKPPKEGNSKSNEPNEPQGDGQSRNGEAKYTDDDLDKIIAKKLAEAQKKQQKAVDQAKKLAEMNAQEKAEFERDALQKKLDSYEKESNLASMSKVARTMLESENISLSDSLLAHIVSADADSTKETVDGFITAFNKAVDSQVKKVVGGQVPKKNSNSKMTKEQIMAVKDSVERQKLIAANISMFH